MLDENLKVTHIFQEHIRKKKIHRKKADTKERDDQAQVKGG